MMYTWTITTLRRTHALSVDHKAASLNGKEVAKGAVSKAW